MVSKPTGLRVAWEVSGFLEKGRVLAAKDGLWRGGKERGGEETVDRVLGACQPSDFSPSRRLNVEGSDLT